MALVDRLAALLLRASGFAARDISTSVGPVRAYVFEGHGPLPPLVVQHGIAASATDFLLVLRRLRPHFQRIIATDLPGHGASPNPNAGLTPDTLQTGLLEALDSLITEPVVFFGNSLGGLAAIRYALARPSKVRGLLLSSPGGAGQDEASLQAFLHSFSVSSWSLAATFVGKLYARPPWYRWLIAPFVRARFTTPALSGFVQSIHAHHLLTATELAQLTLPVYVQWGRQDHLLPAEHLAFFQEALPAHTILTQPEGVGHCPYLDRPEIVVQTVREFAASVESQT